MGADTGGTAEPDRKEGRGGEAVSLSALPLITHASLLSKICLARNKLVNGSFLAPGASGVCRVTGVFRGWKIM